MDIRLLGVGDEELVRAATPLFDDAVQSTACRRFLEEKDHFLFVAYDDLRPVGFVSGLEMTHPDKGTEMFLYELFVAESHRQCGIGRLLVERLSETARERGCYGMWVITDEENFAARATYAGSGGEPMTGQVVYSWQW